MKRILLFTTMLFMAMGVFAQYVDLALPSGTKWKKSNEPGFYTYEEAVSKFGSQLPTLEQLDELVQFCTWEWLGSGYKVIGPSGDFIYLPAAGYRGCYGDVDDVGYHGYFWSSTPSGSEYAHSLSFGSGRVDMYYGDRCIGRSVRLVQD